MIDIPITPIYSPDTVGLATAVNYRMDATAEKWAVIFRAPKTGSLTKLAFSLQAVTLQMPLRGSLQGVSASTGAPDGTNFGGSAPGVLTAPVVQGQIITLATPASVTRGDLLAAVFEFDLLIGDVNFRTFGSSAGSSVVGLPYSMLFTVSWAKVGTLPMFQVGYSDGSYDHANCGTPGVYNGTAYNSSSTPDERALRFKLPYAARLCGARIGMLTPASAALFDVVLYDSDGTTVLASCSCDPDQMSAVTGWNYILFSTAIELLADTYYRLAVKPTTTTNIELRYEHLVLESGQLEEVAAALATHLSTRSDGDSWTNDTIRRPPIVPLIDQIEVGGGSFPIFGSIVR